MIKNQVKTLPKRRRESRQRESELLKAILDYAKLVPGLRLVRMNTGATVQEYKGKKRIIRFGFPGMSDLIGWKTTIAWDLPAPPGIGKYFLAQFVAIEVKCPGQSPTKLQQAFLVEVTRAGGIGFVASSLDEVMARFPLSTIKR